MAKFVRLKRLRWGLLGLCGARVSTQSMAQQSLSIAAFSAFDEIVRSAIPTWKMLFPNEDPNEVSRQFGDHHTAMTTALSTSFCLPGVMAFGAGYVSHFEQATNRAGAVK